MWYKVYSELHIPQGYEVDILKVTEAKSMTLGYNEGMHSTRYIYAIGQIINYSSIQKEKVVMKIQNYINSVS